MSFLKKKPLLLVGLLVLSLVVLPVTIFLFQQQQETRSRADKTVILSYEPSSTSTAPLQIPAGSTFSLDVFVDPGASSVSFVKAEMLYDPARFELAGGFIPNQEVFSQVVEGPVTTPGKLTTTLSIGSDLSKALKSKTKVGTLTLKVLSSVPTNETAVVTFGSGSQALAVSGNTAFNENVIASTVPASVKFNQPTLTCGTSPADAMLVIDKSGSMNEQAGTSGTKISGAKTAANNFIDVLAKDTRNTVGLSTFASTGSLNSPLTNAYATVKNQVNAISASGGTCIECGILKANQEITSKKRTGIKNVVILLTDGLATHVEGNSKQVSTAQAEERALTAATNGHTANGTVYFTIGLGKNVNSTFLTKLAESTGGQYYFTPTTDQLNSVYTQISQILAKGSVAGLVFNDTNSNGVIDSNESNISGWVLQLQPSSGQMQTITTDSTGSYAIANLCDGSYTLTQVKKSGWKQTFPAGSANHSFSITNGNATTDKNFGNNQGARCSDGIDNDGNGFTDSKDGTCHTDGNPNNTSSYDPQKDGERGNNTCSDSKDNNGNGKIDGEDPVCHTDGNPNNSGTYDPTRDEVTPTATPTPSPTPTAVPTPTSAPTPTPIATAGASLALNILMHGIGNSGDNANPLGFTLSNKEPLHPIRNALVTLYDVNNALVATGAGTVTYSSASGSFVGTVITDKPVTAGKYLVRVRSDYHLTRLLSGIQTIVTDQTTQLPDAELVTGDVNNNNQLDIIDYNLLLDCYSDLTVAPACNDQKKLEADINDDSNVNQFDYNLFLREISTQPGE